MKRQINFCLFILALVFTGLIMFLVATKNIPYQKTFQISWILFSMIGFSLWVFVLGIIRYTKQKYIEAISSNTNPQEEFLRIKAIVSLPSELFSKQQLTDLIRNKPTPKKIPDINKTIQHARIIFEEGLKTNTS